MSKEQLYHYNDTIDQLQQENERLKKEIAEYKEVLETYKKKPVNIYQVEIRNLQVDKAELKLELEEKDKDIEELKKQIAFREQLTSEAIAKSIELLEKNKHLRHEICEKIRKQFDNDYYWCYGDNHNTIVIVQEDFNIILDQIERGEK